MIQCTCLLPYIHRRWIDFFLNSDTSYFDTPAKGPLLLSKRTRFGGQKDAFCKTTKKSIENDLTTRANNKQLNINNKG